MIYNAALRRIAETDPQRPAAAEDCVEWAQAALAEQARVDAGEYWPAGTGPQLRCYQCDAATTWLAPDSRCGKCTHYTPEEVRGDA